MAGDFALDKEHPRSVVSGHLLKLGSAKMVFGSP
jgi:hypothetical protein